MKREPIVLENIFANGTSDKDMISKIYKEFIQLCPRKTHNPIKKMGKGLEQTLLQGRHTEGPETYKKISASLAIREMQIKTTMRYHLTPVRVANINKSTNKCWRRCRGKGTLVHNWWECRLV